MIASVWVQSTIICIHNVGSSLVIFTTYGLLSPSQMITDHIFSDKRGELKNKQHYQYAKSFGMMFTCRAPWNFASLVPASFQPTNYTLTRLCFSSEAAKFTSIGVTVNFFQLWKHCLVPWLVTDLCSWFYFPHIHLYKWICRMPRYC